MTATLRASTGAPSAAGRDIPVGLGRMAVSVDPGATLSALGLGSCIGLVMVDVRAGVAGLAHVMLPASRAGDGALPGKFADTAAPALLAGVVDVGANPRRIVVKIAGGAQMFAHGSGARSMAVGMRNEEAVRAAVDRLGLRVRAAETGGGRGRTLRVEVATGRVTVRSVGGEVEAL